MHPRSGISAASAAGSSYQSGQFGGGNETYPNTQSFGHRAPQAGYSPTNYDSPNAHGISSERFYGSLIDASGKPTEVFSRLADALFFHMDRNCDVVELRNTGMIEPTKYIWMAMRMGLSQQHASIVLVHLQSFYETAGVPYKFAPSATGGQIPVLDRRAWLHATVFEAKAAPAESYKHWSRAITMFSLRDPATNQPFPTPLPRSALPYMADFALSSAYSSWRVQAIASASRMQAQARAASMMRTYRHRSMLGAGTVMALSGAGMGMGMGTGMGMMGMGMGMNRGAGMGMASTGASANNHGGNDGGQGDHATWKDTATAVANLANTIIGVTTGSSSGGGGTGGMFGGGAFGFV